jgi:hypothetical protein
MNFHEPPPVALAAVRRIDREAIGTLVIMVSQQLVEQWRVRLAAWQQRLDEGRPRPWLARAYVRVLSYLLAQYSGQAEIEPPPEPVERAPPAERATTLATDLAGKPARTSDEIRSVLESVTRKVPRVAPGPYLDGLPLDDTIVVAAYYSAQLTADLRALLARAGIESRSKWFRRQTHVIVRAGDLERAKAIAASHAKNSWDSSLLRRHFDRTWMRRGGGIGLCVGMIVAISVTMAVKVNCNTLSDAELMCAGFIITYSCIVCFTLLGSVIGLLLGTIADE